MNKELLASLLDTIEQPALLMDRHYKIVESNNAYKKRYNFDPKLQNATCYQVSHGYKQPCDEEGESCPLKESLETHRPQRAMHIHNTPEGKEHIDVHLEPIFDTEGKLIFFLETLHEINKRSSDFLNTEKLLVGESSIFNNMLLQLSQAANSNISVLLLGESGTGKELAARFLHENSTRKHKPFVTVECSGLSDTLFESELFGHVKGAFTGATSNKKGLVAAAQGGTLFLDELGDIPLTQQVKLLRLIETGIYRQVGSIETHHTDFRLVCATNKNLETMIEKGEFREDLYYRVNSFPVNLPALRERGDDITIIAKALLQEISSNLLVHLSEEALEFLQQFHYPGNVRQLRNMLERANILRNDNRIELKDVIPAKAAKTLTNLETSITTLKEHEKNYLKQLDTSFTGSKTELARLLGISERTLFRKLQSSP